MAPVDHGSCSLTTVKAGPPRVPCNCLASPGVWGIQTTGSPPFNPLLLKEDREVVPEGECDPASFLFIFFPS